MHNIKDIRNNFEEFKNQIKGRNFDANLDSLVELDKENRNLIQEKEKYEMQTKNRIDDIASSKKELSERKRDELLTIKRTIY